MLGSDSPRKVLAPFTATKTEAMIANHKESLEHWDLKTSDLTPSIASKATDKVYHNSCIYFKTFLGYISKKRIFYQNPV